MIRLSRESMESAFEKYLKTAFEHPEIISAGVRNIIINRENIAEAGNRAFEAGFHDCFSDVDLSVKVRLPSGGSITPDMRLYAACTIIEGYRMAKGYKHSGSLE